MLQSLTPLLWFHAKHRCDVWTSDCAPYAAGLETHVCTHLLALFGILGFIRRCD